MTNIIKKCFYKIQIDMVFHYYRSLISFTYYTEVWSKCFTPKTSLWHPAGSGSTTATMLRLPLKWKPASAASSPDIQRQRPAANRPRKPALRAPNRGPQPSVEPTSCHQRSAALSVHRHATRQALPLCYQNSLDSGIYAFLGIKQQVYCKDFWEM